MTTRPHFNDLKRRYREADWVSEYQRLWAIFNHWLFAHCPQATDRDCIEALKAEAALRAWAEALVQNTAYPRRHDAQEGYGGSYPHFAADNELSRFFRAAYASKILAPRINLPWRPGSAQRVRKTNAITLTREQFRAAYEAHALILASEQGIVHDETLHQVLPALGVGATGCCFYRVALPPPTTPSVATLGQMTLAEFRRAPALTELVALIDSNAPTALEADVLETLYNLRNVAMHGSLDFLNEADNAAARAGYDVLDALIQDIRDRW